MDKLKLAITPRPHKKSNNANLENCFAILSKTTIFVVILFFVINANLLSWEKYSQVFS